MFPYYALGYDLSVIKETISKKGLMDLSDSHPFISNCRLNFLMIDIDYRKFGYNSRLKEFASLVREGNADRLEWLSFFQKIESELDNNTWEREKIDSVLEKLGLTDDYEKYITACKS